MPGMCCLHLFCVSVTAEHSKTAVSSGFTVTFLFPRINGIIMSNVTHVSLDGHNENVNIKLRGFFSFLSTILLTFHLLKSGP